MKHISDFYTFKFSKINESYYLSESNEQPSILGQVAYFIKDKYGNIEYANLLDANPIALQDGNMTLDITTEHKPKDSKADIVNQALRGWISSYKKYVIVQENIQAKTKLIQDFINDLLKKYPINTISLTYHSESETEDIINIDYIEVNNSITKEIDKLILKDIIYFSDINSFNLLIDDILNKTVKFYKYFGFSKNIDARFDSEYIRISMSNMNESSTGFSFNPIVMKQIKIKDTIQDKEYLEEWYEKFITLINSKEYKERRYRESTGIMVYKKKMKDDTRIGFAIVGSSKVV